MAVLVMRCASVLRFALAVAVAFDLTSTIEGNRGHVRDNSSNLSPLHGSRYTNRLSTGLGWSDADSMLQPPAFRVRPTGTTTPRGWLLKQLKLQAEGLSGHISQFWPDVSQSVWIGGTGDGGLHERTPYWLNGVVPLAFQLRNAGIKQLPPVRGIYKVTDGAVKGVDLLSQGRRYIHYIMEHQNSTNGWLGPEDQQGGDQYWSKFPLLLAMAQYAEAVPEEASAVAHVMIRYLQEQQRRMAEVASLDGWSKARWAEAAIAIQWILDNREALELSQSIEPELISMLEALRSQGADWEAWFESLRESWPTTASQMSHNVNIAMGLKTAAVLFRMTGNNAYVQLGRRRLEDLQRLVGLPTGMFVGDEHLPMPRIRSPSRGSELCGVVEEMFSLNILFSVFGEPSYADRAEQIAYNALPATWASPRGGDMWSHQYLQAVNEINALASADPHVWQTDGPDSEMYGLEPNFGCCTANFNQGWPKFADMVVLEGPDDSAAVGVYAPVSAVLSTGATVTIETDYPFSSLVQVVVETASSMLLHMRIPSWSSSSTLNGEGVATPPGSMHAVSVPPGASSFALDFHPSIRLAVWDGGAVSVHRGALMFSLPIGLNFTVVGHHFGEANDYEVTPTSEWRYALVVDLANPSRTLTYHEPGYEPGSSPFNHTGWPCYISAKVRRLKSWRSNDNSAADPPPSPACNPAQQASNSYAHQTTPQNDYGDEDLCGPVEDVILVPHGGTDLRIGEFPVA